MCELWEVVGLEGRLVRQPGDQQQAGGGIGDPGPFGGAGPDPRGEPHPGPEKPFNIWGLRNSEPQIEPSQIGRQLDMAAEWYEHLFTMFLKASESGAPEAWMHGVVAIVLLADAEFGIFDEGVDQDDLFGEADRGDGPDGGVEP